MALFVIDLTHSATDLGLVLAAYGLPLVVFLLLGGVLADRMPRHRVVVVTDLARFALHGLLALLIVLGDVHVWQVAVIGVLFGSADAFYRPAGNGLLPQTVPEDEIQQAWAVTTLFENVAAFAGPALATALVLGLGPAAAFGLDAATFLVSAVLLLRLRPRERGAPADAPAPASVWADARAGYREVRSRTWVWVTLATFCVGVVCANATLFVVGPLVAREHYGHIAVYGYVLAAFGAGTLAGSLAAIRWRPRYPLRSGMALVLLLPAAIALFAAGAPLAVAVVAMASGGAGTALFDVWWMTALAERIPQDKLSRVSSYDWAVSLGLMPLGFALAGPLASALGATTVLLGGALIALVAHALGLLPRATRMLERRDDPPDAVVVAHAPTRVPVA